MSRLSVCLSVCVIAFAFQATEGSVWATTFPYGTRTKSYSGWTPAVQSDTDTVGLAGAVVALPYSISSAEANPAGFAMETASVSAQINRVSVTDSRLQPDGQSIDSSQWGLGVSPGNWGFAIAYYSPITENAIYTSPNTGDVLNTEASLKELHFTVAHAFFEGHVAVGLSGVATKAVRELGPYSYDAYGMSYQLGALVRARDHILFGLSYTPPLTMGPVSNPVAQNELPGFNQALLRPSEIDVGAGWVPNRFFKVGASVAYVGSTANTALLADQSVPTGITPALIPRLGAIYALAQYAHFESDLAAGSYYAPSRIDGDPSRLHATCGLDVNPYFVNLGVGFDIASGYHNIMFGIGLDIVRTARTFGIIPPDPTPPLNGLFPDPRVISADGLPDNMTTGEARSTHSPDVTEVSHIIRKVPSKVMSRLKDFSHSADETIAKGEKKMRKKPKPKPLPPSGDAHGTDDSG